MTSLLGWMRKRHRAFGFALRGLRGLLAEPHARVHGVAMLGVVVLGAATRLGRWEWVAVVLAVALVWVAEALNTALEALADAVAPHPDPRIGAAKDLAAAAVLLAALGSVAVGAVVFVPRFCSLIG